MCSKFRPHQGPLLPSWTMDRLLPGVLKTLVVTARQCKSSSGMCSKFRPHQGPLLPSWTMDRLLPGVLKTLVVTARQCKSSSRMCSKFRPHLRPLLRSWTMDRLLAGVLAALVVTAQKCKVCSSVYSFAVLCCSCFSGRRKSCWNKALFVDRPWSFPILHVRVYTNVSHHVANLTMRMVLPFWVLGWGGLGFTNATHHVANLTRPMVLSFREL